MAELRIIVLGSAAGGGFPQWNCGCAQCAAVREGDVRFEARTEDSLAVSAGDGWFLLNASPSIALQLTRTEALRPSAMRGSPIRGVVLTSGDLDHCLGLFSLREWHPLAVYATARVWRGLQQNAMLNTLRRFPEQLVVRDLAFGTSVELRAADGRATGIRLEAFPSPGKPPLHLAETMGPDPEDNIGVELVAPSGRRAVYLSAAASVDGLTERLSRAELVLFDGTFFTEEEPREFGAPHGALAMAHLPVSGAQGSLAQLTCLTRPMRLFTHVNNTNPMLDKSSEARRMIARAGWDVARDGMQFTL